MHHVEGCNIYVSNSLDRISYFRNWSMVNRIDQPFKDPCPVLAALFATMSLDVLFKSYANPSFAHASINTEVKLSVQGSSLVA